MATLLKAYFNATHQVDSFDATHDVKRAWREAKVKNGLLTVFTPSATAGVILLENDPRIKQAFQELITSFVADSSGTRPKRKSGSGFDAAHLRAAFLPSSLSIPIQEGALLLGHWQDVVLFDFDDRVGRVELFIQVIREAEPQK